MAAWIKVKPDANTKSLLIRADSVRRIRHNNQNTIEVWSDGAWFEAHSEHESGQDFVKLLTALNATGDEVV